MFYLFYVVFSRRVIDFYVRTAAPIPLYFLPSALLYRIHLYPYVAVPAWIVINIAIQVVASKKDRADIEELLLGGEWYFCNRI